MRTSVRFDSRTGFSLSLEAESLAEKAVLHALWEARERLSAINRDASWHESYKLTNAIEIHEVKP